MRAEGFLFSHVADEGWMDGCAGPLLRYRNYIGCQQAGPDIEIMLIYFAQIF